MRFSIPVDLNENRATRCEIQRDRDTLAAPLDMRIPPALDRLFGLTVCERISQIPTGRVSKKQPCIFSVGAAPEIRKVIPFDQWRHTDDPRRIHAY